MTLPRGFKAAAERAAKQLRADAGLEADAVIDIVDLVESQDVPVIDAAELIDVERLEEIERLQAFAFSAATFMVEDRHFIVTNPLRTPERRASDVAHEFAHVKLNHDLAEVREIAGVPFRTCRPDEEEQATAYGATLLLPRPLLQRCARRRLGPAEIAVEAGVTIEMARYRYNTTGVATQYKRPSG